MFQVVIGNTGYLSRGVSRHSLALGSSRAGLKQAMYAVFGLGFRSRMVDVRKF